MNIPLQLLVWPHLGQAQAGYMMEDDDGEPVWFPLGGEPKAMLRPALSHLYSTGPNRWELRPEARYEDGLPMGTPGPKTGKGWFVRVRN